MENYLIWVEARWLPKAVRLVSLHFTSLLQLFFLSQCSRCPQFGVYKEQHLQLRCPFVIKESYTGPALTNTYLRPNDSSLQRDAVLVTLAFLLACSMSCKWSSTSKNLVRKKFYKYKHFFLHSGKLKGLTFTVFSSAIWHGTNTGGRFLPCLLPCPAVGGCKVHIMAVISCTGVDCGCF